MRIRTLPKMLLAAAVPALAACFIASGTAQASELPAEHFKWGDHCDGKDFNRFVFPENIIYMYKGFDYGGGYRILKYRATGTGVPPPQPGSQPTQDTWWAYATCD